MRRRIVAKRGWMSVLTVSLCMAISAIYELLEWAAALVSEEAAESFLGTQGDNWDTQTDMFCALIGAIGAVVLLRFVHNRSLRKIQSILVKDNKTAD